MDIGPRDADDAKEKVAIGDPVTWTYVVTNTGNVCVTGGPSELTGWRAATQLGIRCGIPVPALGSALSWFDGYRSAVLPANLLQAQRDYFGAHTYERVDNPRGDSFHTNWTGRGGTTSSTTYDA